MSLIYSFIQTEYTQIFFNEKGLNHQKKKKNKRKKQKIEKKKDKNTASESKSK